MPGYARPTMPDISLGSIPKDNPSRVENGLLGTVHDYRQQNGSPEEEAGYTASPSHKNDEYGRYPADFPSLFEVAIRSVDKDGNPTTIWWDLLLSFITELVACLFFAVFVNHATSLVRIYGVLLALPVHGIVVGIAAGFVAFVTTALMGHGSVRLNPAIVFVEMFMWHHWSASNVDRDSRHTANQWGWTFASGVVLMAAQFVGYLSGAYIQKHLTSNDAYFAANPCLEAALPVNGAGTIGRIGWVEFFGALFICLAWFHTMLEGKRYGNSEMMRSWVIGGAYFVSTVFAFRDSSAIFNAWRYVTSGIVAGEFCATTNNTEWYVYVFTSLGASILAAAIFVFVLRKTGLTTLFGKTVKDAGFLMNKVQ